MPARDPGKRARTLAAALEGVADALDKYRLLEELHRGEPGRTVQRRDAMRQIAERFPGALREWDEAPVEEISRRRAEAEEAIARLLAGGEAALPWLEAPERTWLRLSMYVHGRLREALRVKRWLGRRPLTDDLAALAERALHVDPGSVAAVSAPPGRRISEAVYRTVAAELGITIEQLKAALFPRANPNPQQGEG